MVRSRDNNQEAMMRKSFVRRSAGGGVAAAAAAATLLSGRGQEVNYDEANVPKYVLPDPLVCRNGRRVQDAAAWRRERRPEILELFRREVYGRSPGKPEGMRFEVTDLDLHALEGKAVRKQVTIWFTSRPGDSAFHRVGESEAGSSRPEGSARGQGARRGPLAVACGSDFGARLRGGHGLLRGSGSGF